MIVYDIETFPNCFTFCAGSLDSETETVWEISHFRDDRVSLFAYLDWLQSTQTLMIGFNNEGFDYPVMHFLYCNRDATVEQIYAKAMSIIGAGDDDRFTHTVWASERFAPQVDLFKMYHFDNKAKMTSLKALQFAMRSESVEDMPIEVGTMLGHNSIGMLIEYNMHDVQETRRFARHSKNAIDFRTGLVKQFGVEVYCWNDVKIGCKMLEKRLGDDVCYDRDPVSGRRVRRQTPRASVALRDVIFPYIKFDDAGLNRVLEFMRAQTLKPDDMKEEDGTVETKGVFKGLTTELGGLKFKFGTGGVHASVERKRYIATDDWLIRDIDVEGLYPNIAIKNQLAPEHLGQAFIQEYTLIPVERKKHAKGTVENASLKLAANGPWGQSNNKHSVFFDPKYAMTIPVNGQLMLCMLVEKLVTVPTLQLIQVNTDGVTYTIHRDFEPQAAAWCKWWEAGTLLKLEDVSYAKMFIRDVNSYVAVGTDGKVKLKGAYEYPDPTNYHQSISRMSPPGWHKDWSALAVTQAAVWAMLNNGDPETHLWGNCDPFDFMLRAKANRGCQLRIGNEAVQRTTRYYISKSGAPLTVERPPPKGYQEGWPKRGNRATETEYLRVMQANGFQWDATVCTQNRSVYERTQSNLQSGWNVRECNRASDFDWSDLNRDWYVAEARKLMV